MPWAIRGGGWVLTASHLLWWAWR
eukprot:SAG11_NODE_45609_length_143_cov_18.272727_1_plen_23_part_01